MAQLLTIPGCDIWCADAIGNGSCGNYESDRNEVSGSNRHQSLPHSGGALLLHAQSDSKQPAHPRIHAMVGAEKK